MKRPTQSTPGTVRLEGIQARALEKGRNRLVVTGVVLTLAYALITWRLVDLTVLAPATEPRLSRMTTEEPARALSAVGRANIVDRSGIVLATSLPTVSLFANPTDVLDAAEATRRLVKVLPNLDRDRLRAKLSADGTFVWIKRNLTPKQHYRVNRLGLPGLYFQRAERRVYPNGREASHILGLTDVDGRGLSGVERQFDRRLRGRADDLALSIDIRIQAVLRHELQGAVEEFSARGASGVVMDVESGEILSLVSLPDFDPNVTASAHGDAAFNNATKGVYEMGSTFKLFTTAMALDSGTVGIDDGYDASKPIRVSRFTISDYHAKNRWLSVPEILVYSSNIGAAKMALDVGAKTQKAYLRRLGLLDPATIELPEVGTPLMPARWRDINTMTISYGHGIAVSPLQLASAVATVVNGGTRRPSTVVRRDGPVPAGDRVLSDETSRHMRDLMRLVVRHGTGRNAEARGYLVGGKTGTAEKLEVGGYRQGNLISSFVGVFPMTQPRYVVLALLDEPKGTTRTHGYATGGWVAAPVVGRVIGRMAPLVGLAPIDETETPDAGPSLFVKTQATDTAQGRNLATN
jgi:cell division protein FtsI (penicillin-binding protein 3)